MRLLVLTRGGLSRWLALATAATISGMSAVVKGRTSELLLSFARFGLEGVLLFGPFLLVPTTGFWFFAGGSFHGALADLFGSSVFFADLFGGGLFLVLERGGAEA